MATDARNKKFEVDVDIVKADEAKHLIYGVVMEPNLRDSQGDIVTPEEIEKAAHKFLVQSRKQDVQHSEEAALVQPVESYVAPQDMILGTSIVRRGAWVMVSKVFDEEIWKRCTDPEHPERLTGYSIGGTGLRQEEVE